MGAICKREPDGSVSKLKGGVRFYGSKANGAAVRPRRYGLM